MNIKLMWFFNKLVFTVLAMTLILKVCVVNAQSPIAMDGSTGTGSGANQNFDVPGANQVITINGDGPNANGTQSGSNIFFSFSQFGIATGDTALFQCPGGCAGVTNVISRVNNYNGPSVFDGTLISIIGNANFWFFNPGGVIVNGTINIPLGATYHISDSSGVYFSDPNAFFDVTPSTSPSSLTSANPVSFAFSESPITIIEGTNINSEDTISTVAVKTVIESVKPVIDIAQMNSSSLLPLPKSPCDNRSQSSLISKGVANYIPDLSSQVATSVLTARSSGTSSSVEQAQYLKLAEEEGCQ